MPKVVLQLYASLFRLGCEAFHSFEELRHSVAKTGSVHLLKEGGESLVFLMPDSFRDLTLDDLKPSDLDPATK